MKKIISIITLITFLASDLSFAQEAIHLAPAAALDDIAVGTSHDRNIAVVAQMALQMDLDKMAELEPAVENAASVDVLQSAYRKLKELKKEKSDKPDIEGTGITVFFNEPKYIGGHIFTVPVRVVERGKQYDRTLLFSTVRVDGGFQSVFCSEEALQAVRERVAVQKSGRERLAGVIADYLFENGLEADVSEKSAQLLEQVHAAIEERIQKTISFYVFYGESVLPEPDWIKYPETDSHQKLSLDLKDKMQQEALLVFDTAVSENDQIKERLKALRQETNAYHVEGAPALNLKAINIQKLEYLRDEIIRYAYGATAGFVDSMGFLDLVRKAIIAKKAAKTADSSRASASENLGEDNPVKVFGFDIPGKLARAHSLSKIVHVVGVPKEIKPQAERVALTPAGVRLLANLGVKVIVESGAGRQHFSDKEYKKAGAIIVRTAAEVWRRASIIKKVKEPLESEYRYLKPGQIVFTYLHLASPELAPLAAEMVKRKVMGIAYETIETLDSNGKKVTPVLRPMSVIAGDLGGYFAAVYAPQSNIIGEGPERRVELTPEGRAMMARVKEEYEKRQNVSGFEGILYGKEAVVLGGGVSGERMARRLLEAGAAVTVTDVDNDRLEELKRIFGAYEERFIPVPVPRDINDVSGELMKRYQGAEILGGCILVPGGLAPQMSEELFVKISDEKSGGKPKTVVDIALDQGGNFPGSHSMSHADPVFIDQYGNKRYCVPNMPDFAGGIASIELEKANIAYTLALAMGLDEALEIFPELKGGINVYDGKISHPKVAEKYPELPRASASGMVQGASSAQRILVKDIQWSDTKTTNTFIINLLTELGIEDLNQLAQYSEEGLVNLTYSPDMYIWRGFGTKTLNDIRRVLAQHGRTFAKPEEPSVSKVTRDTPVDRVRWIPVDKAIGGNTWLINVFEDNGIMTVRQVAELSDEEILSLKPRDIVYPLWGVHYKSTNPRQIGYQYLQYIKATLKTHGIRRTRKPTVDSAAKDSDSRASTPEDVRGSASGKSSRKLHQRPVREDRWDEEVFFDSYANGLYRIERKIRMAYGDDLVPFSAVLRNMAGQIETIDKIDNLSQPELAELSKKLRSKIRPFENRFKKAHRARDNDKLTELNSQVINLLKTRLKAQLQLLTHWLEVAKTDRRKLGPGISALRGAILGCKKISSEYGWQRRRRTGKLLVEKIRAIGRHGIPIESFLYKDLDIKVFPKDREHPAARVTIRQERWVTVTLSDGTKVKERRWRDISYDDWPSALRSQVHTIVSQEEDYENILYYMADLDYCRERLSGVEQKLPDYIREQVVESLTNALVWAARARGENGRKRAAANLELALAKLKENNRPVVIKEIENAMANLEERRSEIEGIKGHVDKRLESIYVHIRNLDIKGTLRQVQESFGIGDVVRAGELVSDLYDTYFSHIADDGAYKFIQAKLSGLTAILDKARGFAVKGRSAEIEYLNLADDFRSSVAHILVIVKAQEERETRRASAPRLLDKEPETRDGAPEKDMRGSASGEDAENASSWVPSDIRVLSASPIEGVKTLSVPQNNRVVVCQIGEGDLSIYINHTLKELKLQNNEIRIIKVRTDLSDLSAAIEEIAEINPAMIFLPHKDDNRPFIELARSRILDRCRNLAGQTGESKVAIFYETAGMARQYNLICPISEKTMEKKRRAMRQYPSQMDRLPYHVATEYAMRANIRKARLSISADIKGDYAEFYQFMRIKDGEVQKTPPGTYYVIGEDNIRGCERFEDIKGGLVIEFSPHYDDAEIATGGLGAELAGNNEVIVVDMTEGHRAEIPGVTEKDEKVRVREGEAENASRVIGAKENIFLRLPFYDNTDAKTGQRIVTEAEKERVYQVMRERYLRFRKSNPDGKLVVFMPQEKDAHPDHVATHNIGLEVTRRLSREEGAEAIVLFYIAPWAGEANVYKYVSAGAVEEAARTAASSDKEALDAMLYSGKAAAIVATELTTAGGFGAKALTPEEIGGEYAERLNIVEISPAIAPTRASASGQTPKTAKEDRLASLFEELKERLTKVGWRTEDNGEQVFLSREPHWPPGKLLSIGFRNGMLTFSVKSPEGEEYWISFGRNETEFKGYIDYSGKIGDIGYTYYGPCPLLEVKFAPAGNVWLILSDEFFDDFKQRFGTHPLIGDFYMTSQKDRFGNEPVEKIPVIVPAQMTVSSEEARSAGLTGPAPDGQLKLRCTVPAAGEAIATYPIMDETFLFSPLLGMTADEVAALDERLGSHIPPGRGKYYLLEATPKEYRHYYKRMLVRHVLVKVATFTGKELESLPGPLRAAISEGLMKGAHAIKYALEPHTRKFFLVASIPIPPFPLPPFLSPTDSEVSTNEYLPPSCPGGIYELERSRQDFVMLEHIGLDGDLIHGHAIDPEILPLVGMTMDKPVAVCRLKPPRKLTLQHQLKENGIDSYTFDLTLGGEVPRASALQRPDETRGSDVGEGYKGLVISDSTLAQQMESFIHKGIKNRELRRSIAFNILCAAFFAKDDSITIEEVQGFVKNYSEEVYENLFSPLGPRLVLAAPAALESALIIQLLSTQNIAFLVAGLAGAIILPAIYFPWVKYITENGEKVLSDKIRNILALKEKLIAYRGATTEKNVPDVPGSKSSRASVPRLPDETPETRDEAHEKDVRGSASGEEDIPQILSRIFKNIKSVERDIHGQVTKIEIGDATIRLFADGEEAHKALKQIFREGKMRVSYLSSEQEEVAIEGEWLLDRIFMDRFYVVVLQEGNRVRFICYSNKTTSLASPYGIIATSAILRFAGHDDFVDAEEFSKFEKSSRLKGRKRFAFDRLYKRLYAPSIFGGYQLVGMGRDGLAFHENLVEEGEETTEVLFEDKYEKMAFLEYLAGTRKEIERGIEIAGKILEYIVFKHPSVLKDLEVFLAGIPDAHKRDRLTKAFQSYVEKFRKRKAAYRFYNIADKADVIKEPPPPGERFGRSYLGRAPLKDRLNALAGLEEATFAGELEREEVERWAMQFIHRCAGYIVSPQRLKDDGKRKDEFAVLERALSFYANLTGLAIEEGNFETRGAQWNPWKCYQYAAQALGKPMKSIKPSVASSAPAAGESRASASGTRGDVTERIRKHLEKFDSSRSAVVGIKALKGLVKIGKPAVPSLIERLNYSKGQEAYWEVALALGEIGDVSAAEPLINALRNENRVGNFRSMSVMVRSLIKIGEPAVPALIEALGQERGSWIRISILETLGGIGGQEAVKALIHTLDDDGRPGETARWLLTDKIRKEAIPALKEAVTSGISERIRSEATQILAEINGASKEGQPRASAPRDARDGAHEKDVRGSASGTELNDNGKATLKSIASSEPLMEKLCPKDTKRPMGHIALGDYMKFCGEKDIDRAMQELLRLVSMGCLTVPSEGRYALTDKGLVEIAELRMDMILEEGALEREDIESIPALNEILMRTAAIYVGIDRGVQYKTLNRMLARSGEQLSRVETILIITALMHEEGYHQELVTKLKSMLGDPAQLSRPEKILILAALMHSPFPKRYYDILAEMLEKETGLSRLERIMIYAALAHNEATRMKNLKILEDILKESKDLKQLEEILIRSALVHGNRRPDEHRPILRKMYEKSIGPVAASLRASASGTEGMSVAERVKDAIFTGKKFTRGGVLLLEDEAGERDILMGILERMGLKVWHPSEFKPGRYAKDRSKMPSFVVSTPKHIDEIKAVNPDAQLLIIVEDGETRDFAREGLVTVRRRDLRSAYKVGQNVMRTIYGVGGYRVLRKGPTRESYSYSERMGLRVLPGNENDYFVPHAFHPPVERFYAASSVLDDQSRESLYGWGRVISEIEKGRPESYYNYGHDTEKTRRILEAIADTPLEDIGLIRERQRVFDVLLASGERRASLRDRIRDVLAEDSVKGRSQEVMAFESGGSFSTIKDPFIRILNEPIEPERRSYFIERGDPREREKERIEKIRKIFEEALTDIPAIIDLLRAVDRCLEPGNSLFLKQIKNNLKLLYEDAGPSALPHITELFREAAAVEAESPRSFNDAMRPIKTRLKESGIETALAQIEDAVRYLYLFVEMSDYFEENGWTRPEMLPEEENILEIQDGWNPLIRIKDEDMMGFSGLDATSDEGKTKLIMPEEIVRNSFCLDDRMRGMIITGPNMDGKTVAIQTALWIDALAQTGLYVPASKARLSMRKRIVHRTPKKGSIEHGLSSFGFDVETMRLIRNRAARGVLLGIDELGRHTNSLDGSSLAYAVLQINKVRKSGAHILVATHFGELTELARYPEFRNWHMDYRIHPNGDVELRCKLKPGKGASKGLVIAKALGLPDDMVEVAEARLAERMLRVKGKETDISGNPAYTLIPAAQSAPYEEKRLYLGTLEDLFDSERFECKSDVLDAASRNNLDGWSAIKHAMEGARLSGYFTDSIASSICDNPTQDTNLIMARQALFRRLVENPDMRGEVGKAIGDLMGSKMKPGKRYIEISSSDDKKDRSRFMMWRDFLNSHNAAEAMKLLLERYLPAQLEMLEGALETKESDTGMQVSKENGEQVEAPSQESQIRDVQTALKDLVEMFEIIHGGFVPVSRALEPGGSLFLNQIKNSLSLVTDETNPKGIIALFAELKELAEYGSDDIGLLRDWLYVIKESFGELIGTHESEDEKSHTPAKSIVEAGRYLKGFVSMADYFAAEGWSLPVVLAPEEQVLDIKNGWHPVLRVYPPSGEIVRNSVRLDKSDRVMVLTGSNMNGKSCLEQMALYVQAFAQSGLYVPAAPGTRVSIVRKIIHRISGRGTIEHSLSSFGEEIEGLKDVARDAGPYSLVALDEPGRSTNPMEGDAIAWTGTRKVLESGARGIVITHFEGVSELATIAKLPGIFLTHVETKPGDGGLPVLTHKMVEGEDTSDGIAIARLMGLPRQITDMADARREELKKRFTQLRDSRASATGEQSHSLASLGTSQVTMSQGHQPETVGLSTIDYRLSTNVAPQVAEKSRASATGKNHPDDRWDKPGWVPWADTPDHVSPAQIEAVADEAVVTAIAEKTGLDAATVTAILASEAMIPKAFNEKGTDLYSFKEELVIVFVDAMTKAENDAERAERAVIPRGLSKMTDRSVMIFSEKLTFTCGLGRFLPRLTKSGIRVAVVAPTNREKKIIDVLNFGKPDIEKITCGDSIPEIMGSAKAPNYYYFRAEDEPKEEFSSVTTIYMMVEKILAILGRITNIVDEPSMRQMDDARKAFAQAA